ncbi:hypothetical protein PLICRDRAFT_152535 [Plicaturopsis crispa FD-325 SS-3]|nr:hypothetical protein PLICRDRAFT_152535 [Plicaturopsis crispa FD-325 SS-3]
MSPWSLAARWLPFVSSPSPIRRSRSAVYLDDGDMIVTPEFDYPLSRPTLRPQTRLPLPSACNSDGSAISTDSSSNGLSVDTSSPSCSSSSNSHAHAALSPSSSLSSSDHEKRRELIHALNYSPPPAVPDPDTLPQTSRKSRKLRKAPPKGAARSSSFVQLSDLSMSPSLPTHAPSSWNNARNSRNLSKDLPPVPSPTSCGEDPYGQIEMVSTPTPTVSTLSAGTTLSAYSQTPLIRPTSQVLSSPPSPVENSYPAVPPPQRRARKLSKRRPSLPAIPSDFGYTTLPSPPPPLPTSPVSLNDTDGVSRANDDILSTAVPLANAGSTHPIPNDSGKEDHAVPRRRRKSWRPRKSASESGHGSVRPDINHGVARRDSIYTSMRTWAHGSTEGGTDESQPGTQETREAEGWALPPMRNGSPFRVNTSLSHQKWHTRSSYLNSGGPLYSSVPSSPARPSMNAKYNTDALASFAWTGLTTAGMEDHENGESGWDFGVWGEDAGLDTRRWTLATAMGNEDVSDEGFVEELERMRIVIDDGDVDGDDGTAEEEGDEKAEKWRTARRALLCCRELVITERRYQENLRALVGSSTAATPPPPLMASYVPALLRASETLLARLEDDPSAWGVATAFMGCEEEIGAAMIAWCGIVGEFFAPAPAPHRSSVLLKPKPQSDPTNTATLGRTTGTGPRRRTVSGREAWRKSLPDLTKSLSWARGSSVGKEGKSPRKASVRELAIQPTQRIMRYVLLYRDLLKHTPPNSPSRALVEDALGAALRIAQKCDRAQGNAAFLRAQ